MTRNDEKLQKGDGCSEEEQREPQSPAEGSGPLLQRDCVLVLDGSQCTPEGMIEELRAEFPCFSPAEVALFRRPPGAVRPLELGDTMHVLIQGFGEAGVEVSALEPRSLTLQTLAEHPEAGRIAFGAYGDESGHLVCRIRSRARLRDVLIYAAYALLGRHGQTLVWVTFLQRLAQACGGRPLSQVITATAEVTPTPRDLATNAAPLIDTRFAPSG